MGKIRDAHILLAGKLRGKRTLLHVHQGGYFETGRFIVTLNVIMAGVVIVPSRYMLGRVPHFARRKTHVVTAPGTIPVAKEEMLELPSNSVKILIIANAVEGKGVPEFLIDLERINMHRQLTIRIVGAPLDSQECRRIADAANFHRTSGIEVSYESRVFNAKELESIIDYTNIGLIPSLALESQCLVGVEMLSRGVPLVVNAKGALPELVMHGGGCIYEQGKTHTLQAALEQILADFPRYQRAALDTARNVYDPQQLQQSALQTIVEVRAK